MAEDYLRGRGAPDNLRDFTTDPNLPVEIKGGTIAVAEDGFDVVLTLVLRLGTNEALDLCLRTIGAVSRIKGMPGTGDDRS